MANTAARVIVPIAEVAAEAYKAVFGQLGLLFDRAWLLLLIMLAATLLPGYLHIYVGWQDLPKWGNKSIGFSLEDVIEALAGLLCLSAFAVRWHQMMLFPADRGAPKSIFVGAWMRFLLYTLLLYLISGMLLSMLIIADTTAVPTYLTSIAGVAALLVWVATIRCSLLFPAAAFGRPLGIPTAWQMMRGNSWRLLACGMVACVPVILAIIVILGAIFSALHLNQDSGRLPLGFFILHTLIGTCANFLVVALGASVLSAFYRRIVLRSVDA